VTQDVPGGRNSRNRAGEATDFPLIVSIPATQSCTGTVAGQDNVCLVRCQNGARAGPFGGVVPVQLVDAAGAGAGNETAEEDPAEVARRMARRSLAKQVRDSHLKLERLRKKAVSLAEDLHDPDVLAEILEELDA
jgi:hypothetical protein